MSDSYKEIEQRTRRYWYVDGLAELFIGLLLWARLRQARELSAELGFAAAAACGKGDREVDLTTGDPQLDAAVVKRR